MHADVQMGPSKSGSRVITRARQCSQMSKCRTFPENVLESGANFQLTIKANFTSLPGRFTGSSGFHATTEDRAGITMQDSSELAKAISNVDRRNETPTPGQLRVTSRARSGPFPKPVKPPRVTEVMQGKVESSFAAMNGEGPMIGTP